MSATETPGAGQRSNILCLEVLIPKSFMLNSSHHLFRTLSLYSLHNHPVKGNPLPQASEMFHFMAYDWNRTIRDLLDERRIPYSILRHFYPDSVYFEHVVEDLSETVHAPLPVEEMA